MELTESLGQFELMILTAVMVLEDDAYGMQIYGKVCEMADREVNLGSVYVTLGRLEKKKYVASRIDADSAPEQRGKPRKFYTVRPAGEQALRESVERVTRISQTFWSFGKWTDLYLKLFPKRHPKPRKQFQRI